MQIKVISREGEEFPIIDKLSPELSTFLAQHAKTHRLTLAEAAISLIAEAREGRQTIVEFYPNTELGVM